MIWTGSVDFDPGELPPDLHLCLRFARANGAHWLLFDQDADEREDLPMYEDDDVICRQLPWGDERDATASWLPGLSGHQIVTWTGRAAQGWPRRANPIEALAHHTVQDSGLVVGS